jgi:hypothetical protein
MTTTTGKIFISYRRDDSAGDTGRIYDRLVQEFGHDNVFKDVDSIPFGVDFAQHIDQEVGRCQVLLVVMGKNWVTPRLQNPNDFVRLEIESALGRNIPVVPVFLEGVTAPPPRDQLPVSLHPLIRRNGTQVWHDPRFHADMDRLIKGLRKNYFQQPSGPVQPSPPPATTQAANPAPATLARPPIPQKSFTPIRLRHRRTAIIFGWGGIGVSAVLMGKILISSGNLSFPDLFIQPQSPSSLSSELSVVEIFPQTQPENLESLDLLVPESEPKPKPEPSPSSTQSAPVTVEVRLSEPSWLSIVADGKSLYEGIATKGVQKTWSAQENLVIQTGNAGAVSLAVNGDAPVVAGATGAVKTFTLTSESSAAEITSP